MKRTVLVADEARVMRRIILRAVHDAGLTDVVEAGNGNKALLEFEKQPIYMVLTDWDLPGANGLEVVERIRAVDSQVPIIMISKGAEKTRVLSAIEAGVTDYLIKPFDADTLRAKIEKHAAVPVP